jgi:hypothetical protein
MGVWWESTNIAGKWPFGMGVGFFWNTKDNNALIAWKYNYVFNFPIKF